MTFKYSAPALDSFTLLLDSEKIQIKDKRLTCKAVTAYIDTDTGHLDLDDIENPRQNPTIKHSHGSFSTYYKMTAVRHGSTGTRDYLTLTVNSKHLGSKYLEGLQHSNIKDAYDLIQEEGIFSCSFSDFLSGLVWDVDIKRDFYTDKPYAALIKQLKKMPKPEYRKLAKAHQQKTNQGFQVSRRDTAAYPMLKTYNKELELLHNSSDFASEYLKEVKVEYPYRTEVTLRRKSQMKKYGLLSEDQNNSLGIVLKAAPERGVAIISKLRDQYLIKEVPAMSEDKKAIDEKLDKLEKERYKIGRTVKLCVRLDMSLEETVEEVIETHQPSKNYLARFKRIASECWDDYNDILISEAIRVVSTPFEGEQ
ncbi:hypothetical protein EOPP23_16915 [Endozoicomonas sp. OPT23]|uniref:hypothetical protein n=1 Tax=Endozoicomonas sp. OPT23 TaxID=2072845 RepID=UPI00129B8D66|nr:hypothetical protein [Endozoicomonas sp. OPT23]MRI34667.1 hypothetical protein [Endozoicomonas sp. OPT23]